MQFRSLSRFTACAALLVALLFVLLCGSARAQDGELLPSDLVGPGPLHVVWIERAAEAGRRHLESSGALVSLDDYESFAVATVNATRLEGGIASLTELGLRVRDELALVPLHGRLLDGFRPEASLGALDPRERLSTPRSAQLPATAGLYLVQFRGPARDAWLDALRGAGARIVQYVPMSAFVVAVDPEDVPRLELLGHDLAAIRHLGVWEPGFRMHPEIREALAGSPGIPMETIVQVVAGPRAASSIARLAELSVRIDRITPVGPYVNVAALVDPARFLDIASDPGVFALEPGRERVKHDERQGQIVAGNVSGSSVGAPGYLAWLAARGFGSGQFTGFSVNVVDDAHLLSGHPDLPASRIAFENNPTNQNAVQEGHGFLNAHIVAGYNDQTGSLYEDAGGHNYGLGIAPWARVGSTAIFGPNFASTSATAWENTAYLQGARISTNSWGYNFAYDYDSFAQEYDFIVRDARSGVAGNQEMAVVFSAGNDGSFADTISSPATAKNVITVGASENDRQTGVDGCAIGNNGANNVDQVISFSSRGPVDSSGGDGRWKPEIVAPGTHIQAGVPQSNYSGTGVCNQYWPNNGQTLYGWSSGTSHSAPAVAGGAALLRQWMTNQALGTPSPALTKAWLAGTSTYMATQGGTLPSNTQGMGRMDLDRAFDTAQRILVDQTQILSATGQTYVVTGNVADPAKPFRVVLSWTDAPGSTTGAPWVNDLDLRVDIGGSIYRGNVFSGANSVTGGSPDAKNNTEAVFLPAGASGPFTITITAATIAGDGVPGNGDSTDQDFALFVHNGSTGGGMGVGELSDGSFELQTAGAAPVAPWNVLAGSSHLVLPAGGTNADDAMPTDGSKWAEVSGVGSTAATPPSNPGGAGSPPVGTTGFAQVFSYASGATELSFEAAFIRNENANETTFNDFMSVDVSDGSTSVNLYYADTFTPTPNVSARHSLPMTAVETVTVDLATLFPSSTDTTVFTLTVGLGNGNDGFQPSLGYVDDFRTNTPGSSITADFSATPTSGPAPLNVAFTPSVTGTVSTWFWTFGDGQISLLSNPSHVYQNPGSYDVSLTVTGPDGSATETKLGYVTVAAGAPTANFVGSPTSGSAPLTVNFTDTSSGAVTSRSWNFGDGGTSTQQNPSHTYTNPGTYDVTLTVTGPGGSDAEVKTGYVTVGTAAPVAAFSGTPTSGVFPLAVAFTDASTGAVTSWNWSFGDGGSSTQQNPSHTYTSSGVYTVTLTVTGPGGSDSEIKTGYVAVTPPAPIADFSGTPTSGGAPLAVSFTAMASGGPAASYFWAFGDGQISFEENPTHVYQNPGNYDVSLTVSGPGGSDVETKLGYVSAVPNTGPTAEFSASSTSIGLGDTVNFSDLSTGTATSWLWDFGDGNTSTQQNPSHTYALGGAFTVSLTVTGPGGADTETKTAYIRVAAIVSDDDLFLSFDATTTLPGLGAVEPEDIVRYDVATGTWSMHLDGSDLGLAGNDITGVHVFPNGDLIFAIRDTQFLGNALFAPPGQVVTHNDLLYWLPTSTGENSAGSLYFVFNGSDVGLDGPDEAIDGIFLGTDNILLLSTVGQTVTSTTGTTQKQDVLGFQVSNFFFVTIGTFFPLFDGSDVGLAADGEDIDALHFDLSLGLAFSTTGDLAAGGVSADRNDITRFVGAYGSTTLGGLTKIYDFELLGVPAGADIDAYSVLQNAP